MNRALSFTVTFGAALVMLMGPAFAGPKEQVERLDRTIGALAAAPDSVGRLGQLRAFVAARGNHDKRNTLAAKAELALPPPITAMALDRKVAGAMAALRVQIKVTGEDLGLVDVLKTGLGELGYRFPKTTKGPDVVIHAATEASEPEDQGMFFRVEAVTNFEVEESIRKKVIAKFREVYRDGSEEEPAARERALTGLAVRIADKAMVRLDRILKGLPTR